MKNAKSRARLLSFGVVNGSIVCGLLILVVGTGFSVWAIERAVLKPCLYDS